MGGLGLGACLLAACTPTDNSSGAVSAATLKAIRGAPRQSSAALGQPSSGGLSGFDEFASTVKTFISDCWMAETFRTVPRRDRVEAVNRCPSSKTTVGHARPIARIARTAGRSADLSAGAGWIGALRFLDDYEAGTRIRPESTTITAPPTTLYRIGGLGEVKCSRGGIEPQPVTKPVRMAPGGSLRGAVMTMFETIAAAATGSHALNGHSYRVADR
jgi:hypothetical protein